MPTVSAKQDAKKRLYLIDGYAFVFRAYHSIPPMTRRDGTPVNAVYGFTSMIMKIANRIRHTDNYMLVAFDTGKKTFRNDMYSEYKAHRPPTPEDLRPQFSIMREAVKAIGLKSEEIIGYEADDIIATYAKIATRENIAVTIVSSDKDLMQLIDNNVEMFDAMKNRRVGEEEVVEKFGVPSDKVLDVLSLMGDAADNIPGVPGIGAKIAAELINRFGSLDSTLENAHEVKQKKRRENLIEFAEQARLSKDLVTLCETVPVDGDITNFTIANNNDDLIEFIEKQEFWSLIPKIDRGNAPKKQKEVRKEITNITALKEWLAPVKDLGKLTIHISDKCISIAGSENYCSLVTINENTDDLFGKKEGLAFDDVMEAVKHLLEDDSVLKIGHDVKRGWGFPPPSLAGGVGGGVNINSSYDDIMVMSYILDGAKNKHDLDTLLKLHSDLSFTADTKKTPPPTPPASGGGGRVYTASGGGEENPNYASEIIKLHTLFKSRLFKEHSLTVYETLERPLIKTLFNMEQEGITVDAQELKELSREFTVRISDLEHEIFSLAGHEFNIGSPKQLGEILFDEMNIHGGKTGKSGSYVTSVGVLTDLAAEGYTIASSVIKWRELSKLKNTYTDALVREINPDTGRVHTTFAMAVTSTGRLSSLSPNLQNIPIRTEDGKKIRKAFVAKKGCKLIAADYSQIELRILADMADIKSLKQAFLDNRDIHVLTASQVFGVPIDSVDGVMRRRAKAINFGIIYGQSAFGLANQLGISRSEASDYINNYFEQYPGIRQYMEEKKEEARKYGYVSTLFGRKCFINGINDKNGGRRQFAERAAINAPIQGTAADIIKKAMISIDKKIDGMLLQVHDELVLEADEQQANAISEFVKKEMEGIVTLSIPLTVETKIGDHWGEIH